MTNYDCDDKSLISPATTPGSIDERCIAITNFYLPIPQKKEKWYKKIGPPYTIIAMSLVQILFFLLSTPQLNLQLRFHPNKQSEIWRFLTYMMMHDSWHHLLLNVFLQCLFATLLENVQKGWRVVIVYIGGGIGGALGAACVRPDLLVGASAGVYALLTSVISHFILNFQSMKYKTWICISVSIIILSDIFYNVYHYYIYDYPTISWGAHIFGAIMGFLLGLLLYKHTNDNHTITKAIFYCTIFILTFVLICLMILDLQIKRCTNNMHYLTYSYFC